MTSNSALHQLEQESIRIIREAVAEAKRPVMLYSVGKDSSALLHLAQKPGPVTSAVEFARDHRLLPEAYLYGFASTFNTTLLAGGGWALGLQALAFASLHWPSTVQRMHGDLLLGLAAALAMFVPMGLALGVIFDRTRNVLAPCLVHVGVNLVSDVL